jgi:hypothetical protein
MAMLLIFLMLPWFSHSQTAPETFVIDRVEVHTTFDAAYVLALANAITPPNKSVTEADVECLLNEIRATGLFRRVETKWERRDDGVRRLLLYCTPKSDRKRITISKFSLIDLSDVNENEFLKRMGEKGAFVGMRLVEFPYERLNDIVDESIHESVPAALASKYNGSAWIQFRKDPLGNVEVRIFPERPVCKSSAAE